MKHTTSNRGNTNYLDCNHYAPYINIPVAAKFRGVMGSMIVEIGLRKVAHEDFDSRANAGPYSKQSPHWASHEDEHQTLINNSSEWMRN